MLYYYGNPKAFMVKYSIDNIRKYGISMVYEIATIAVGAFKAKTWKKEITNHI